MKKVKATIDPAGLSQISEFFDQCPRTIFLELLQNSRRANATRVDVTVKQAGESLAVTFTDNGDGVENEEDLVTLCKSGWDDVKKTTENPAGFGFFSLSHLPGGVTVESRDWSMHIDKHVFSGLGEATSMPTSNYVKGTILKFHLQNLYIENFKVILAAACLYGPLEVSLNSKLLPQEDFLYKALHVEDFGGYRVGVYETRYQPNQDVNFYGLALCSHLPVVHEGYRTKIDVTDARCLNFVKPTRHCIINDQKYKDMLSSARAAVYKYFATGVPHRLHFDQWVESSNLGIKLPEAEPYLSLAKARDTDGRYLGGGDDYRIDSVVSEDSFVTDLDNDSLLVLHYSEFDKDVFQNDSKFNGYSWYPRKTVSEVVQKVMFKGELLRIDPSGCDAWKAVASSLRNDRNVCAEHITVEITTSTGVIDVPSYVAFVKDECGTEAIETGWITTVPGLAFVSEDDLSDLFFYESCDCESDSYQTQHDYFMEEAASEIVLRSQGEAEMYKSRLIKVVQDIEVRFTMQKLGLSKFTVTIDDKGKIGITFPPPPVKKPIPAKTNKPKKKTK